MDEKKQISPSTLLYRAEHVDNKFVHSFSYSLPGAMANDANNWKTFWIAPVDVELTSIMMYWTNANNIACTAQVENVSVGTAPGGGDDILTTAANLNSASTDENEPGYLQTDMNAYRVIPRYHRVGIAIASGALQDLSDFLITITYKPLGRGGYKL